MAIFLLLATKLLPLYALVAMGFFAGRKLKVERESIARIVFYLLVPVIIFAGVVKVELSAATLALPVITYAIAAFMNVLFLRLSRFAYKDATANILACTAGTGNTGYFGLPVAMALFDEQTVAIYIMLMLGTTLAESSIGYFLAARGHATWQTALQKTLRLPTLYAAALGLLVQVAHIPLPEIFWDFVDSMRGTYVVLGMMIVGLGIAGMRRLSLDLRFIGLAYSAKFLVWPVIALGLAAADSAWLGIYSVEIHHALFLLAIVPMAANTVVIATLLNTAPEKVASAVLISTLIAVVYVPAMIALFIGP